LVEELRALLPEAGWWPVTYWHLCIEQRAVEQKIMEKIKSIFIFCLRFVHSIWLILFQVGV
jgi:hypothetical protein